jgi:ribosomal protein S18 acetylase RimI-like enzyme
LKSSQVYKKFRAKNDQTVVLRSIRWEDLPSLVDFANSLVEDRDIDPDFGILLDRKQTLETEADYLGNWMAAVEKGEQVHVVADVDRKLVGNSEVTRGKFSDEFYHGKLGIAVHRDYRGLGIGLEMMKTLVEESRKLGLKTIELETFATNPRAIRVYEKVGFKQVGRIPKKILRKDHHIDIIVMSIEL